MSLSVTFSYLPKIRGDVLLLLLRIADDFRIRREDSFPHRNILGTLTSQYKTLNPDAKSISERTFERACAEGRKLGLLEITQPVKGFKGNCYRIHPDAYEKYPNLREDLRNLIDTRIRQEKSQMKKIGGILQENKYIITHNAEYTVESIVKNLDQQWLEFLKEQYKDVKPEKPHYKPKPRKEIPDNFSLREGDIKELLYIWHKKDIYDIIAVIQHLTSYCKHNKITSDDWYMFAKRCVNKHFRGDYQKTKNRAYMLRLTANSINQDESKVPDTQPRVVNTDHLVDANLLKLKWLLRYSNGDLSNIAVELIDSLKIEEDELTIFSKPDVLDKHSELLQNASSVILSVAKQCLFPVTSIKFSGV